MRGMPGQGPAEDKVERKKRRQAAVKELNRVAKDLDPACEELSPSSVSGAEAAGFYRAVLSNPQLGSAGRALLRAARDTMVNNG